MHGQLRVWTQRDALSSWAHKTFFKMVTVTEKSCENRFFTTFSRHNKWHPGQMAATLFHFCVGMCFVISSPLLRSKWHLQMVPFISVRGCNCRMPGWTVSFLRDHLDLSPFGPLVRPTPLKSCTFLASLQRRGDSGPDDAKGNHENSNQPLPMVRGPDW